MEEKLIEWIPLEEVDFTDEKILGYHIDTRDFHVLCIPGFDGNGNKPEDKRQYLESTGKWRRAPENFLHTPEEIKTLLNRYYAESGGKNDWRMLTLAGERGGLHSGGWEMKYIRIQRTDAGLIVFDSHLKVLSKEILSFPVNTDPDILCAHTLSGKTKHNG